MRIAKQLLLGALALSRFVVADDDGDDDEYEVYGNTGANNQTTPQVREGNHTVHFVSVGNYTNNFYPNSIVAEPGDIVMFKFWPTKHSVVQAAYGYPCIPYDMIHKGAPTFYSGWKPVADGSDDYPVWNLTINDTQPIFYYCGAPQSCNYWGMVGGINLNASTPISNQIGLARLQDFRKVPGDKVPSEAQEASLARLAASSTMAPFTVTTAAESMTSEYPQYGIGTSGDGDDDSYDEHHGLSNGAVAGIAVGSAVVAVAAVGLLWLLLRTRSLKKKLDEQRAAQNQPGPGMQGPMAAYGQTWPSQQSRQTSQLPPYRNHAGEDMYKPLDSEGYPISDVPSRGMSPHHQGSPYNMQGQFVGFQPGDGRQNRYTTHSELSGTVGPMVELDAPKPDIPDQHGRYQ